MKANKFMNQKASAMTISELANAIRIKENALNIPTEELKIGGKVRVIQYWCNHNPSKKNGKVGTLTEMYESRNYPFVVDMGGYIARIHEVEKVDTSVLSSAALPEESMPKSLSDKKISSPRSSNVWDYKEEDVKAHLKRFLDWVSGITEQDYSKDILRQAKEEFGTRLV